MIETIKIGRLKWQNIPAPSDEDLEYLENTYHFHPLDLEDCRQRFCTIRFHRRSAPRPGSLECRKEPAPQRCRMSEFS